MSGSLLVEKDVGLVGLPVELTEAFLLFVLLLLLMVLLMTSASVVVAGDTRTRGGGGERELVGGGDRVLRNRCNLYLAFLAIDDDLSLQV